MNHSLRLDSGPAAAHGSARSVAVDVADPDLDADVRAVLAALSLTATTPGSGPADVLVTDRADPVRGAAFANPDAPLVIRVCGDGVGVGVGDPGPGEGGAGRGDGRGDDDEVVPLPSGTARLVALLSAPVATTSGRLVAVVGAVGGCGASTVATALAVRAASAGQARVLLVEGDPGGTGLDLLLGAESTPGPRLDDVRAALGGPDPDAVWQAAPRPVPGCAVLARARGASRDGSAAREGDAGTPGADGGLGAALAHRGVGGLVVCDVGRSVADDPVVRRADHLVVVTRADLSGAVAAGRVPEVRAPGGRDRASVVVRVHRGDPLHAGDVADAAGLARWHALPELAAVRGLAGAGDLGRVLAKGGGGRVRRLAAVADRLLGEVGLDVR